MTLDAQILRILREAGPGAVLASDLSKKLDTSPAIISSRIEGLRSLGYVIETSPHFGLRLVSSPESLHAEDLLSRLPDVRIIGRDIQVFTQTTSTNDVIEKLARDGVKEGVVVFAESQTRGRGRLGRAWLSPAGKGLWFSLLLRPALPSQKATQLTVAAATALRRAIASETGLIVQIKWPNDLLVAGKKVAGILTELNAELDQIRYAILGLGVDVNLDALDFPPGLQPNATSIKAELGRTVSRPELAARILRELDQDYSRILSGGFQSLAEEWEQHCSTLGREVVIRTGNREIRGHAESLDEDGALLLRTEHGHLERIVGGDVNQ